MTFSLLCKNKVVDKPLDHMKNHELVENRMILTPNIAVVYYVSFLFLVIQFDQITKIQIQKLETKIKD